MAQLFALYHEYPKKIARLQESLRADLKYIRRLTEYRSRLELIEDKTFKQSTDRCGHDYIISLAQFGQGDHEEEFLTPKKKKLMQLRKRLLQTHVRLLSVNMTSEEYARYLVCSRVTFLTMPETTEMFALSLQPCCLVDPASEVVVVLMDGVPDRL